MSWVSASRPHDAVIARGRPIVNSGSTIARRGNIPSERRLAFTPCSGERNTALRVTSLPVPAVVGTAIIGTDGCVRGCPRPTISR